METLESMLAKDHGYGNLYLEAHCNRANFIRICVYSPSAFASQDLASIRPVRGSTARTSNLVLLPPGFPISVSSIISPTSGNPVVFATRDSLLRF
jgi:hypothetical protein